MSGTVTPERIGTILDNLAILHLDQPIPCEYDSNGRAVFVFTHECGESWLYCHAHRAMFEQRVEELYAGGGTVLCDHCGGIVPRRTTWLPL